MIQKISCLLLIAGLGYLAAGCKKEKTTVPPQEAHFNYQTRGSYFVTQDANTVYKIPIGLTTTSDQDRTIQFTVASPTGAAEGQQYTLDKKTVTIPAGKAVDTIYLKGKFSGYPTGRKDTLVFTITSGDVIAMPGFNEFKVILQKYCPVVLSDLEGAYDESYDLQVGEPDYGPYSTFIKDPLSTGATKGKITIENFWDVGTSITVELDWTDPANFKTTIPSQFLYNNPTYGPATIAPVGNGTFSSCDKTFTFSYTVSVAAGSYGNFTTTIHL